jgi:hypothetical protein
LYDKSSTPSIERYTILPGDSEAVDVPRRIVPPTLASSGQSTVTSLQPWALVVSKSGVSLMPDSGLQEATEQRFKRLADQWRKATAMLSSTSDIVSHPAYLKIIGMGERAVPLILRELQERGGHWFVALRSITEENPVPPESAGKMKKMAEAWVLWGHQKGLI